MGKIIQKIIKTFNKSNAIEFNIEYYRSGYLVTDWKTKGWTGDTIEIIDKVKDVEIRINIGLVKGGEK